MKWKCLPYTVFAITNLRPNMGTPVWQLLQAMTLFFPQAREKKSGFSTPALEDGFGE